MVKYLLSIILLLVILTGNYVELLIRVKRMVGKVYYTECDAWNPLRFTVECDLTKENITLNVVIIVGNNKPK